MNVTVIAVVLAIVSIVIGISAYIAKKPMWFWSSSDEAGEKVEFHDMRNFNHRAGKMWILMGIAFFLPVPIRSANLIKENVFIMLLSCILTIGLLSMMIYWHHLYHMYRKK